MPNMKQGTLSFASAKRAKSAPSGKSRKKTLATDKAKDRRVEIPEETRNDAKRNDALEISSDEEAAILEEITVPAKRTRASTKVHTSSEVVKEIPPQPLQSEKRKSSPDVVERDHLDVEDKAGRYHKYYHDVRSKMGHLQPIHSGGQNRIHQMLRFFDMSYEYGPCIGMTRLERWERAEAFGLNPPVEVRDILLTKEGIQKAEYAQCVLQGEV